MPRTDSTSERFEAFAQCAPGLEPIVARELKGLGMKPRKETGGVSFRTDASGLYGANLWLRAASRVVVRMSSFHASTFYELERRAKKVEWASYLAAGARVGVRVTCRKSRLYHSDAVAERILAAISRAAPSAIAIAAPSVEEDAEGMSEELATSESEEKPTQLFVVRIVDDECQISADSSGELLHRRGYRRETGKAPLRETLAAAMVLASGWTEELPLADPLCGSGTIPIEAALIARGIAPGLRREFQFMNWPSFDRATWNVMLESARGKVRRADVRIIAADRDDGVVGAAARNADRAGVKDAIEFSTASLSETLSRLHHERSGWVITNPPYGVRVSDAADIRNLYAAFGSRLSDAAGWMLGILSSDPSLIGQTRLPLRSRFKTRNGGIPVDFFVSGPGAGPERKTMPDG